MGDGLGRYLPWRWLASCGGGCVGGVPTAGAWSVGLAAWAVMGVGARAWAGYGVGPPIHASGTNIMVPRSFEWTRIVLVSWMSVKT